MAYKNPKRELVEDVGMVIDSYINEVKNKLPEDTIKGFESLKGKLELLTNCPCTDGTEILNLGIKKEKKSKGKRERTERDDFMSKCMAGVDKGGEGKSMKECSTDWKSIKDSSGDSGIYLQKPQSADQKN